MWYRDITIDPTMKGLADCANKSAQGITAPRPCNGFLPIQWTENGDWCDHTAYNCADRSDEGNCASKSRQQENTLVGSRWMIVKSLTSNGNSFTF